MRRKVKKRAKNAKKRHCAVDKRKRRAIILSRRVEKASKRGKNKAADKRRCARIAEKRRLFLPISKKSGRKRI